MLCSVVNDPTTVGIAKIHQLGVTKEVSVGLEDSTKRDLFAYKTLVLRSKIVFISIKKHIYVAR